MGTYAELPINLTLGCFWTFAQVMAEVSEPKMSQVGREIGLLDVTPQAIARALAAYLGS